MSVDQDNADIRAGARMKEFLEDEVVKGAFVELERKYFEAFKGADTEEKRTALWAKTTVLFELGASLRTVYDRGKIAQHNREQQAKQEERQATRTRR